MAKGLVTPWCSNCQKSALLQAVGIIGAIIMPHNLYLHSGLVKVNNTCQKNKVVCVANMIVDLILSHKQFYPLYVSSHVGKGSSSSTHVVK